MWFKKKNIEFYTNCEIPVRNFFEFLNTNNYKFLIKKRKRLFKNSMIQELEENFTNILFEYCSLIQNRKLFFKLKDQIQKKYLLFRIEIALKILSLYGKTESEEVLVLLEEIDIKIDLEKERNSEIERIIRLVRSFENQVKILNSKYKKKKANEEDYFNYQSEALDIEVALDLNYSINTSKCQLRKWAAMKNKIKLKNGKS